jgi:Uma2 family endonuclease
VERRVATERTSGLTYQDLLEMFPEEDLTRRELIDGELFVTPSPIPQHQRVVVKLAALLLRYEEAHGGRVYPAPLDVWFTDRDVVQPDVVFLTEEHLAKEEPKLIRSAPDLVVEVSSPSTRRLELTRKKDLYELHGVPEYWFVDLDAGRVEVYRLEDGRFGPPTIVSRNQELGSPLLPGLSVTVEDLLTER